MPGSRETGFDGSFELYYHDGWAFLTVRRPESGSRPVYREDVQNRMKMLGVPRAPAADIVSIIEKADGEPHRLVEWPDGRRLASRVTVTVSEDRQSAVVNITAPRRGALPLSAGEVELLLNAEGVKHGIDHETIVDLLTNERYGTDIVVASGTPAVHARPGEIRYHFDPDRGKPYLRLEYGRIDLRELNFIENKAAGALLAELLPEVAPVDGRLVTGDTVNARTDVRAVRLVAGANTELSPDGRAVHATRDGNVRLVNGAVIVEPVVQVENVDYSTGNIRFEGSVVVEKSIADGFVVEAGGDVQVNRGMGRSTVIAGGNVLLKSGISGGGEGRIECGGNLVAKYVEGSTVTCRENVFVEEAIMHSYLSAARHCVLTGRRAEVISSEVIVGGSLWCKKLGSIAEATTTVHAGVPPGLLADYRQARNDLDQATQLMETSQEQATQIERSIADGKQNPRLKPALEELQSRISASEADARRHREAVRRLRDRLESSRRSMLVVEDTIHAGAIVRFGRLEYRPPAQGASAAILTARMGRIQESGYNPRERPVLEFESTDNEDAEADVRGTEDAGDIAPS